MFGESVVVTQCWDGKQCHYIYARFFSPRSIHSSSRHIDVMRFIRLLHCAITLLPILHMLPNGLTAPLFMPLQPLVTASLTNSLTAWNGRSTGSSPLLFISPYTNARVLAACAAASVEVDRERAGDSQGN